MNTTVYYVNFALTVISILVLSLIFVFLSIDKSKTNKKTFLLLVGSSIAWLISDLFACGFPGIKEPFAYPLLVVGNILQYSLGYVVLTIYTKYVLEYISSKTKVKDTIMKALYIIVVVAIILIIADQFTNFYYSIDPITGYQREKYFIISQVPALIVIFMSVFLTVRYRKFLTNVEFMILLSYVSFPIYAILLQTIFYGFTFINEGVLISNLLLYGVIQTEQSRLLQEKEIELIENRISIMISQIQPHFLYNTLNTIKALTITDSEKAQELIGSFASYLRQNMDSLKQQSPVYFNKELEHVQIYLDIERERFKNRLNVVYDLEVTNFLLPVLTVQSLVENAIRHGLMKRKEGGIVTISTRKINDSIHLTIKDNGVGFDQLEIKQDGRSHVGLENVRQRLKAQCKGSMNIDSKINVGTTVTIIIPLGGNE